MTINWIDRAIGYVSPVAAARRARARAYLDLVARRYEAAGGSRATYGWLTPATSANAEIYGALPILRTRARDLARNNPHAAKAVTALVNNTIGSGIVARPKTGDQNLDRRIVGLWQDFVKEIDADGQLDFYGLQNLVARAFYESGEVLVRRRVRRTDDGLQVPLQYQVLEGDFLDHAKNEDLANGLVRMGVEFDAIGRRRAYWMFPEHPGEGRYGAAARGKSRAVPADQILHLYEKQRPGQIRGVPWLTPVMTCPQGLYHILC
jgi:lambda family phage portal protein